MNPALWLVERLKPLELPLRRYLPYDRFNRVEVETTSSCNRKCGYCPVAYDTRPGHRMEEPLFLSILDQLAEMRFCGRFSPHFYGEPLVDKRLAGFIEQVRKRLPRAITVVYTNGDLLDHARAESLIQAGVGLFIVTYEKDEPEAVRETRARMPRLRFASHFIVRSFDDDVKAPYNRGGSIRYAAGELHLKGCMSPASTLVIDAWGKIKLCCNDYYGREDWGDLKTERLADIWARPDFVKLRKELLRGVFRKPLCKVCVGLEEPAAPLAVYDQRKR